MVPEFISSSLGAKLSGKAVVTSVRLTKSSAAGEFRVALAKDASSAAEKRELRVRSHRCSFRMAARWNGNQSAALPCALTWRVSLSR